MGSVQEYDRTRQLFVLFAPVVPGNEDADGDARWQDQDAREEEPDEKRFEPACWLSRSLQSEETGHAFESNSLCSRR